MSEKEKNLSVGIMPEDEYRKRVLAIARGEYKPGPQEPKTWFVSPKALRSFLSRDKQS